ncbi:hypothetical protein [Herbaspirillum sp. ST 5-3]|uniref:hypothetical protein n=1 Tax=Oxalobacteraceae TaxID=75682 RepID=UPI0010A32125|nr:hypothetical protein [Herbaspirillum sp. ST 5-3]
MKTNAASTSVACYYGVVQDKKQRQYDLILSAMQVGMDYSFRELSDLTGLLPSTISGRINELRDKFKVVERAPRRQCKHTNIHIIPHRIKVEAMAEEPQLELA